MIARLASRKLRCHEALEGYVAAVGIISPRPTVKRPARNSGAAIAGLPRLSASRRRAQARVRCKNGAVQYRLCLRASASGRMVDLVMFLLCRG